jgi:hypothetical protein
VEAIENLVRALCRAFGIFWIVSGVAQLAFSPLLFIVGVFTRQVLISASAAQMASFALPSLVIGAVMVRASGRIARMAVGFMPPSAP